MLTNAPHFEDCSIGHVLILVIVIIKQQNLIVVD